MNRKKKSPLQKKITAAGKKIKYLKIKLYLLFVLPVCILTLGKAVIKEYIKIRFSDPSLKIPESVPQRSGQ